MRKKVNTITQVDTKLELQSTRSLLIKNTNSRIHNIPGHFKCIKCIENYVSYPNLDPSSTDFFEGINKTPRLDPRVLRE